MPIMAHLDPRSDADGRRTAHRCALHLETSGFAAGAGEANVTIHNISAGGLLIETALALAEGDELAIDLPEAEADAVSASVVWHSENFYGCAFAVALGPATLAAVQLQSLAPAAPALPSRPVQPEAGLEPPVRVPGETLGSRINRLRREAGLTLADIAGALGVSKPTVWAWEKGKARPLPERIEAIAAALGVDPALLAPVSILAPDTEAVIAHCRQRIAEACGTRPHAVRIMVEL